ncbi:SusD/RagB family nutrient-binding outer membrane lipoprotein [Chitinophaga caseinilytica]|uniref:SusD/RagB family nutrient-binding outer membrane lipoprotein n=1 Tax=Chitinophaga caseinilytica TaxID=2267521 RepID=UPI003C2E518F
MKKIICILTIAAVSFTSCKKWLDINQNPNVGQEADPTPEQRLPPILAQFVDGYESAGTRAALVTQQLATVYVNGLAAYEMSRWNSTAASSAIAGWPWQSWYVNTAVNIQPMIAAAQKVDAWHYVGVGKIMKAWGFGYMADYYGMLPYDEFDDPKVLTPKFDDGAYVQTKVLALLDEAIANLQKTQGAIAPALSKGDYLHGGSATDWIKMAYALKARFLLHTSKKAGFNPQAVLDLLDKAPKTDDEGAIMQYVDESPATSTVQAALQYVNINNNYRPTKLFIDYLTNKYTGAPTGANNMEDPRAALMIPSATDAGGVLVRSEGVDMASDMPKSGPAASDARFITLRKNPVAPKPGDKIVSTGSWYTQRGGKGLLITNAEMRFIEAEMLFRQGKRPEALAAYKAGIRSHMNTMGIAGTTIDNFLASTSVVQNAQDITMSHIMIQKWIALSYSPEAWMDMRRMNFCADAGGNYNEATGVYKGFKRPSHVMAEGYPNPTDWPRRCAVPSYEINYNMVKVLEANPNAGNPTYMAEPVWWDKP